MGKDARNVRFQVTDATSTTTVVWAKDYRDSLQLPGTLVVEEMCLLSSSCYKVQLEVRAPRTQDVASPEPYDVYWLDELLSSGNLEGATVELTVGTCP